MGLPLLRRPLEDDVADLLGGQAGIQAREGNVDG